MNSKMQHIKRMEKYLYTTSPPNAAEHYCVAVINETFAISFRHIPHSSIETGEKIMIYNVLDPESHFEVVVKVVSDSNNFIILEITDGQFPDYPYGIDTMYAGQQYLQLGINQARRPIWKDGIVSQMCLGFFVGTSHAQFGEPGSGIFDLNGNFIGFSVAKKKFAFRNASTMDLRDVADHHPDTKIVSAEVIFNHLNIGSKDFPPIQLQ